MKILYAIQGTGNGHISRSRDIIPCLKKHGDVDILVSGTQAEVDIPYHIKYRFNGLSFYFGNNGGINFKKTIKELKLGALIRDIKSLPVENYDLVISDFEPISAWSCKLKKVKCIGLSHQNAIKSPLAPKITIGFPFGKFLIHNYAPADIEFGFHFKEYDKSIFLPIVRNEVRTIARKKKNHHTVYLPAYSDKKITDILTKIKGTHWEVFSKKTNVENQFDNVKILPINSDHFIKSMAESSGVICGAGFETPAESLFLGKKLMVLPMIGQYEQQCNAQALSEIGVSTMKRLNKNAVKTIEKWVVDGKTIEKNYPDNTQTLIDTLVKTYAFQKLS